MLTLVPRWLCCSPWLAAILLGCAHPPQATEQTDTQQADTEQTDGGLGPEEDVLGKALTTFPWCGGAVPTGEEMERRRRPRPLKGDFVVVRGSTQRGQPEVASFQTEQDGRFALRLPAADYCVVEAGKRKADVKGDATHGDGACLAQWRRTCDAVWHLGGGPLDRSFVIPSPCFGPCYTGPMPP